MLEAILFIVCSMSRVTGGKRNIRAPSGRCKKLQLLADEFSCVIIKLTFKFNERVANTS